MALNYYYLGFGICFKKRGAPLLSAPVDTPSDYFCLAGDFPQQRQGIEGGGEAAKELQGCPAMEERAGVGRKALSAGTREEATAPQAHKGKMVAIPTKERATALLFCCTQLHNGAEIPEGPNTSMYPGP